MEQQDHYSVLGVASTATAEEIKRAYYKKVRNHPPEKDPEGFKLLRRAYDTLSNEESRANYDAIGTYGDEIIELFDKADELVEAKDFHGAVQKLKKLVVLAPQLDSGRDYLAFCFSMIDEYEKALQQIDVVCAREKAAPCSLHTGGQIRLWWVRDLEDEDREKHKNRIKLLLLDAMELFKRASAREPINAEHFLGISDVYLKMCDYDRALEYVEKAINADGVVDFQDFDAFYKGCVINVIKSDIPALRGMIRRIFKVVEPLDDDEIAGYVAWKFYGFADDMVGIHDYESALELFQASKKLYPETDIDFEKPIAYVKDLIGLGKEYERLPENDENSLLKHMLGVEYEVSTAKEDKEQEAQESWEKMVELLYNVYPARMLEVIERVKRECPTFYKRNEKLLIDLAAQKKAMSRFFDEALRAMKDGRIPEVLRHVCSLVHDLGLGLSEEEDKELMDGIEGAAVRVAQESPSAIRDGIGIIKRNYGALYEAQEKLWKLLLKDAGTSRSWWQKLVG